MFGELHGVLCSPERYALQGVVFSPGRPGVKKKRQPSKGLAAIEGVLGTASVAPENFPRATRRQLR
jgi:hypothetical protein